MEEGITIRHRDGRSIGFGWRPPSEGVSRSSLEAVCDFAEAGWIDGIELDSAREGLEQQHLGARRCSSLPGTRAWVAAAVGQQSLRREHIEVGGACVVQRFEE